MYVSTHAHFPQFILQEDFRFDPECCAELHLRSLELRENILALCEQRRKEASDFVLCAAADGAPELMQHLAEAEGAAFLQAEYSRFVVSLHMLFDYTKAVGAYDASKRRWNALEEALPPVLPPLPTAGAAAAAAAAGKGVKAVEKPKEKAADPKKAAGKGKGVEDDAPPAPYREPIPALALPAALMETLPVPVPPVLSEAVAAVATDDKGAKGGKGGGKDAKKAVVGKGGKDAAPSEAAVTPFPVAEKAVMDLVAAWGKENFRLNRALYDKDEHLCLLLERAVWHEAERLQRSAATIRRLVGEQTRWLQRTEATLQQLLRDLIEARYDRECASCERLVAMVGECIESADPIHHQWLLAPDVVAVTKGTLLLPAALPPVEPVIDVYEKDGLNAQQFQLMREWLSSVALGEVVLEQDLHALLDRSMTAVGPLATHTCAVAGPDGGAALRHLTMPRTWRTLDGRGALDGPPGAREHLVTMGRRRHAGVDEYVGTVGLDATVQKIVRLETDLL